MRKNYVFRTDIAVKYGVNSAILLHELVRMTQEHKALNQYFHKNRHWVCASFDELSAAYMFWSASQIKRMIKQLRKNNLLLADNFNIDPMDRTNWYSPSDEILALYENYSWAKEE